MTPRLRQALGLAAIPTAALVVVVLAAPGWAEPALHAWLLVVLAISLLALLASIREDVPSAPSAFDAALARQPVAPARPPSLARVEREVSMGVETAFDTHFRLRPLFRELAGGMLLGHRGVDLERDPARARTLVGDDLWSLIDPGAPAPRERVDAGMPRAALERAVTDLERIAWS